jgi:murein DD-endopeptidase MepM/ murein hydrolase activator NlpD
MTAEYEVENRSQDSRPAEPPAGMFRERRFAVKAGKGHRIIVLSRTSQVGMFVVGIAFSGWLAYSSYGLINADFAVETTEQAAAALSEQDTRARAEYEELIGQVRSYQQRFAAASAELAESRERLASLAGQNAQLAADLSVSIDQLDSLKDVTAAATADLAAKEAAVDGLLDETLILKTELAGARRQLGGLEQERNELLGIEEQVLAATAKLSKQEVVLDELVVQNLSLKSDLTVAREKLSEASAEAERLRAAENNLVATRDQLNKATAETEKLRVVEADLAAVRDQLRTAKAETQKLRTASAKAASKTARLTKTEQAVAELLDQNLLLKADLSETRKKLRKVDEARVAEIARADQLGEKVLAMGAQVRQLTSRALAMEKGSKAKQTELALAAVKTPSSPDLSADEGQLHDTVTRLERRIAALQRSQQDFLLHVTERTINTIDEAERTIALTGLGVETLLARAEDVSVAMGGPFIGISAELMAESELRQEVTVLDSHMSRWERLQFILRMLPLSAPVDAYRVTSKFGKRKDPLNGRWAMHYGMDMAAPRGSPILVPAAGTVVSAGWHAGFGRTVEVDHGLGIRTRYGHMRSIAVKKGEKVGFRDTIGLLGNSGRSTGPHVHYEILVDGKPVDPTKFLTAGKYVFKG